MCDRDVGKRVLRERAGCERLLCVCERVLCNNIVTMLCVQELRVTKLFV